MKIIADTNTFIAVALNEPEKKLVISLTEGHDLVAPALKIAIEHNTYAYDAYFLECALSHRSPLLTLDRQMREIAGKIGIKIME
jgi:predicted nucleic acid-binding protein